jgi:hypothetical protein
LLVVYLGAEDADGGVETQLSSVSFGGNDLTTLQQVGVGSGYSNLGYFGYMLDADIPDIESTLQVAWSTAPSGFNSASHTQLYYAVYEGVGQIAPIRDSGTGSGSGTTQAITNGLPLAAVANDQMIGFSLVGQPFASNAGGCEPNCSDGDELFAPSGWTEHREADLGVLQNHFTSAVYTRDATTAVEYTSASQLTFTAESSSRRVVSAVVLSGSIVEPVTDQVALVGNWAESVATTTTGIPFNPLPGNNRIAIVYFSAEDNTGGTGPMDVAAVTLGGIELTQVLEFTVGDPISYHNMHWMGYLLESDIQDAEAGSPSIVITWVTEPTGGADWGFIDSPKVFYATYSNVDQTNPLVAQSASSGTASGVGNRLNSLTLASLSYSEEDRIIGFGVLGEPAEWIDLTNVNFAEVLADEAAVSTGHSAAVYDWSVDTSASAVVLSFEAYDSAAQDTLVPGRLAVSAAVLKFVEAAVERRLMTVY